VTQNAQALIRFIPVEDLALAINGEEGLELVVDEDNDYPLVCAVGKQAVKKLHELVALDRPPPEEEEQLPKLPDAGALPLPPPPFAEEENS
jgi:hypothetical protein